MYTVTTPGEFLIFALLLSIVCVVRVRVRADVLSPNKMFILAMSS